MIRENRPRVPSPGFCAIGKPETTGWGLDQIHLACALGTERAMNVLAKAVDVYVSVAAK